MAGCGPDAEDVVAVSVASNAGAGGSSEDGAVAACAGMITSCRADFAAAAFARALCTCGDVVAPGALSTDVIGSATPPSTASVGIDGALTGAGVVRIGGDLTVAGASPVFIAGGVQTAGDFWTAAGGRVGGVLAVTGNAWVEASMTTGGGAIVGGDLHLAPGAMLQGILPASVGGQTTTAPFVVAPPCACGAEPALDVAGALSTARSANDDARINLSPDALSGTGTTRDWQWTCGTLSLDSIGGASALHVAIDGRIALFVQGDVDLPASFALTIAPGAELDWYVGGHFSVAPGAQIGDVARPGAIRLYVLGSGPIALPGDLTVSLSLYAPSAAVSVGGLGEVHGALFAASVNAPLGLVVHDDPRAAAEVCPED